MPDLIKRFWPLIIFVAALTIRLIYLGQLETMPTFDQPIMDEQYHLQLAERINGPDGYGDEPFYRAPLYPYLFAFLYKLTGNSLYGVRVIQIILGSFLPLLIYLLGLKIFDPKIARLASGIAVFYPTFIYFDSSLLITSMMVLLVALLVWMLYRCQSDPRPLNFVMAGVLLGLAGLARPNILLLGPALFLWVWLVLKEKLGWKKAILRYVMIGAASFIMVLPVTMRNYAVSQDFVFIAWQGGFNFYLGNNQQASGWSATVPGIDFTWEGGYREAIDIAEEAEGRQLTKSEVSDYWTSRAFDEIFDNPGAFIGLAIKKVRLLINGHEIPNNQPIYFTEEYTPILKPLLFSAGVYFPFGLIAPLALIGLGFSIRRWRDYLLLYLVMGTYSLTLILFFVCARFRQPILPYFIFFAVLGAIELIRRIRFEHLRSYILPLLVLVLLLFESNHDMIDSEHGQYKAEGYLNIGLAYMKTNKLAKAEIEFTKAIRADTTFAPAYSNLGVVSVRQGKRERATEYFRKALHYDRSSPERFMNLANILSERGEYMGAARTLESGYQTFPNDPKLLLALSMAYAQLGELQRARRSMELVLELDPANDAARQAYRTILDLIEEQNAQPDTTQ